MFFRSLESSAMTLLQNDEYFVVNFQNTLGIGVFRLYVSFFFESSTSQNVGPVHPLHPKITIRRGILATECSDTMQQFFQLRRKKVKKEEAPPPPSISMSAAPMKLLGRSHNLLATMFCV